MDFPLHVETYEIDGRIYRRNPFRGFRSDREAELRGGDTADLYEDNHDGPKCFVSEASFDESNQSSDESYQSDRSDVLSACESDQSDLIKRFAGAFESDQEMENKRRRSSHIESQSDNDESGVIKYNEMTKKWSMKIDVPVATRRFIVGHKGATKRKIEEETECRLIFPGKSKKNRPLEIVSMKSEENIERCRDRIQLMVINARDKTPYTHFVSIPLNHPDIQMTFSQFVDCIKDDEELPENCRDPDLFNVPTKLHFTLVMLSLLDEKEQQTAKTVLEEVVKDKIRKLLDEKPLEIEIQGLDYMNDDPTRTHVLYACAHSEKLSEVARCIANAMIAADLAPRQTDDIKLHMTLMNTTYAMRKSGKKLKMNVSKLMEKYSDFYFGHANINELHISSCYDAKTDCGYYNNVAKVTLK